MKAFILFQVVLAQFASLTYGKKHLPSSLRNSDCIAILKTFKTDSKRPVMAGIILDCRTQEPAKAAIIGINKTIIYTDTSGHFRHQVKPGNYIIKVGWPTYLWQKINTTVKNKDSLFVTFYLEDDTQPLK